MTTQSHRTFSLRGTLLGIFLGTLVLAVRPKPASGSSYAIAFTGIQFECTTNPGHDC